MKVITLRIPTLSDVKNKAAEARDNWRFARRCDKIVSAERAIERAERIAREAKLEAERLRSGL